MSDKNIDGIKKLNKDEIKKSRKILLDYIGEEDRKVYKQLKKSEKIFTNTKQNKKAVDGIAIKKEVSTKEPELPREIIPKPIANQAELKKENIPSEEEKNILKNKLKEIEQLEDIEYQKKSEKKVLEDKVAIEVQDKKKTLSKKQKVLRESRQKIKEAKARVEKKKKKIKAKRKKSKKTNSKKKLKQLSFKFAFLDKLIPFLRLVGNKFYIILFLFIMFVVVFYVIYALLLLKLGVENNFSRFISNIVPVPAIITENGYLEYFDYKDLSNKTLGDKKVEIVKKIIILDLIDRYNISKEMAAENIISEINNNFKTDKNINIENISLEQYLINESNNKKIWFLTNQ
jgi:hypothetical protein